MNSLIEEFHSLYGEELDVTLEECALICTAPFKLVKEVLSKSLFKSIRLQYFGVFEVSSSRVKYSKQSLSESYAKGNISEEKYKNRLKTLENYGG
jgi:hypothetical protein